MSEFDDVVQAAIDAAANAPKANDGSTGWPFDPPKKTREMWRTPAPKKQPTPPDTHDLVEAGWQRIKDLPGLNLDELLAAVGSDELAELAPDVRMETLARLQAAENAALDGAGASR